MLSELLGAYEGRFTMEGDDLKIDDRSATPLALLFHELATNATKYGALSNGYGKIVIRSKAKGSTVQICREERGGPSISSPSTKGFGTALIELRIMRQLGGRVDHNCRKSGLVATIEIPQAAMHRQV